MNNEANPLQEELDNTKLLAKQLAEYVKAVHPFVEIPAFPACTYPTQWERYRETWKAMMENPFALKYLIDVGVVVPKKA